MVYDNFFSDFLLEHTIFVTQCRNILIDLFNNKNIGKKFVYNDQVKSKIYHDVEHNSYYLIVEKNGFLEVFQDKEKSYSTPFDMLKKQLKESPIPFLHGNSIAKLAKTPESFIHSKNLLDKEMQYHYQQNHSAEKLYTISKRMAFHHEIDMEEFSFSAYSIKTFLDFIKDKTTKSINLNLLKDNSPVLIDEVNTRISEFGHTFSMCEKAIIKHQLSKDKCYDFLSDSELYGKDNLIVTNDRNVTFVIDFTNENNYIVYICLGEYSEQWKQHDNLDSLIENIKEFKNTNKLVNDINFSINNIALQVKDGKVLFVDNAFIELLDRHVISIKESLLEDNMIIFDAQFDTTDFDYQVAYHQHKYGYDKLSYVLNALFTLGNGYDYNENTGRIYSTVPYDENIKDVIIDDYKNYKITSLMFFCPNMYMTKLDDKWLDALTYVVDKIKVDKPNTSDCTFFPGENFESIMNYLDNLILINNKNKHHLKI